MSTDLICIIVCSVCTLFHLLSGIISSLITGKKIDHICKDCGQPVLKGEEHECVLTPEQINKVVELVVSLRGDSCGN